VKKKASLVVLALITTVRLAAMGFAEDPQEKLTRSWNLDTVKTLEIRGEIGFEIVPGPRGKVTVETSRALFDQLTVSNWWGAATVAIESGLRGPREMGEVQVVIELPSLAELTVLDRSSGRVAWPPGRGASLKVGENSTVTLAFRGTMLTVEASWLSSVHLQGTTEFLTAGLRHQARLDARPMAVGAARVALDEQSVYEAGAGTKGSGLARHGSRVQTPTPEGWEGLELREFSELRPD